MGDRGPVPKREAERRRRNKEEPTEAVDPVVPVVAIPAADPDWHNVARQWYDSLTDSAQCQFYEPSDWAAAFLLADSMSRALRPQVVGTSLEGEPIWATLPPNGAQITAWLKGMNVLLATEGDRRRFRVEVVRGDQPVEAEGVLNLDDYRKNIAEGGS